MNENKYHHNINLSIHIRYNLVTEFIGPNKTIGERSVLIHCQRLIVLVLFFQATKGKGRGQGEKKVGASRKQSNSLSSRGSSNILSLLSCILGGYNVVFGGYESYHIGLSHFLNILAFFPVKVNCILLAAWAKRPRMLFQDKPRFPATL